MQDKNDINAMAKRYKEEMMLAYSKKRIGNPPGTVSQTPKIEEKEQHFPIPAPAPKIKQIENEAVHRSQHEEKKPEKDLDHPPMPVIPKMEAISDKDGESCQKKDTDCPSMPEITKPDSPEDTGEKWKFLTAEELIKMDSEAADHTSTDIAADAADSADKEEPDHHQGNYDFPTAPDKEYEKEVEDFEAGDGEGYIQVEVTCGENACPIEGAAIAVTRQCGDTDTLCATLVTGADGCTEAVTLPANGEKYMVTVYKEGFFTVRDLDVPIFDTIKSIQPVTMTEIGNKG